MSTSDVIQLFIAIITFTAVLVALFGENIKTFIFPIKIKLELYNSTGELTNLISTNGQIFDQGYFYHLKVVNKSRQHHIQNCSVILKRITRIDNGQIIEIPWTVPRFFQFAPSELYKMKIDCDFTKDIVIDFGRVCKKYDNYFIPSLLSIPTNARITVEKNETVRYYLEVIAKNFISNKVYVYEVFWNGEWSDDPEIMKNNLTIKEIKNAKI